MDFRSGVEFGFTVGNFQQYEMILDAISSNNINMDSSNFVNNEYQNQGISVKIVTNNPINTKSILDNFGLIFSMEKVILVKLLPKPGELRSLLRYIKESTQDKLIIKRYYNAENNYNVIVSNNNSILTQVLNNFSITK